MAMSRKKHAPALDVRMGSDLQRFRRAPGHVCFGAFHLLNRESIPRERHSRLAGLGSSGSPLPPATKKKVRKGIFPCDLPNRGEGASHAILEENVAS